MSLLKQIQCHRLFVSCWVLTGRCVRQCGTLEHGDRFSVPLGAAGSHFHAQSQKTNLESQNLKWQNLEISKFKNYLNTQFRISCKKFHFPDATKIINFLCKSKIFICLRNSAILSLPFCQIAILEDFSRFTFGLKSRLPKTDKNSLQKRFFYGRI